ncbi:MAG TPA: chemotaxis protein CheW [Chloroflexia bacterium]|nr:chemotaxis protein CheW [Chloroflexia bacterium]
MASRGVTQLPRPISAEGRHGRSAERSIEVLLVALINPADGSQQRYGLLVSQVHSIVRLDQHDAPRRVRKGAQGWELAYEETWIPLLHLRQSLGLADNSERWRVYQGSVRILGIKVNAAPDAGPPDAADTPLYVGFVVDEVIEIMTYPLSRVMPFPQWVVTQLPPTTVWAALSLTGADAGPAPPPDVQPAPAVGMPAAPAPGAASLLLLLDGVALAGHYRQR